MLSQLRAWIADGAHRRKAKAGDAQYRHHAAIAIDDELMPNLIRAFYDRILAEGGMSGVASTGGATLPGYAKLPMQWVNTPNSGDAHLGCVVRRRVRGLPDVDPPAAARPASGGRVRPGADAGTSAAAARPPAAAVVDARWQRRTPRWSRRTGAPTSRPGPTRPSSHAAGQTDAGVRLDRVPRPRSGRPAEHRLAEPPDVPAGRRVPPPPPAVSTRISSARGSR